MDFIHSHHLLFEDILNEYNISYDNVLEIVMEWQSVRIKKYKTPVKGVRQGRKWANYSREEKINYAGFKWYRNNRPRAVGKQQNTENGTYSS